MNLQPVDFKAVAAKGCYVYCYLREDGSPYYVGFASYAKRPVEHHHCAVPRDKARIRVLRSGLSPFDAYKWEIFFIAHYGRKDLGTGILRNQTDGGEGCTGYSQSDEHKAKISYAVKQQHAIEKTLGISRSSQLQKQRTIEANTGREMDRTVKEKISATRRAKPGINSSQAVSRRANTAKRYGICVELYLSLSPNQVKLLSKRYRAGKRGADLVANIAA